MSHVLRPELLQPSAWPKSAAWWSGPWWALLVKGIFAIIFSMIAFFGPVITMFVLVILFGAFALVDGIFTLVISLKHRKKDHEHWQWSLAAGAAGIMIGTFVLAVPGISALFIIYFIAAWATVMGILGISNAVRLRKKIKIGWPLATGIIGICFGVVLFIFPAVSALAIIWLIATLALIYGISLCAHSYGVHRESKKPTTESESQPEPSESS